MKKLFTSRECLTLALVCNFLIALTNSSPAADVLDTWHWRNPTPFSNFLRSSCFGDGKFVIVGDGGIIHTSVDGLSWDDGQRPVTNALRKVIYANDQFVAVGHEGVILTSSNGYSWTPRSSGTTNALYSVAYGNGKYVACGNDGQLTVSTDGSAWIPGGVGEIDLPWIAFGNGAFVVASTNIYSKNQIAVRVSVDGQTWTTTTFPENESSGSRWPSLLYEVAFGNGIFVATANVEQKLIGVEYNPRIRFFTSSDGTNWNKGSFAEGLYNQNYTSHGNLSFANGEFYEFVYQEFVTGRSIETPDGNASTLAADEAYSANSMTYANGRYLLTALDGRLWTSTVDTNWTPLHGGFRTNHINRVIRGADKYLAVANGGPILASSDGMSFSPVPGSPSLAYGDIGFDGTNYVAVAESGKLYTSGDGITWTQRTSNTGNHLKAICRGESRWVVVGWNGTVITSPNTLAWTLRSSGTANTLNGVAFGNGTYVAVGDGGSIISSTDAATWDVQFSGTTDLLTSVRFLNGQFFAVGANGTILSSADGSTWQARNSGVSRTLKDIAFGDGRFVACGSDLVGFQATANVLLQSTNGIVWENITTKIPVFVGLNAITFLNESFFVCGENGSILQSDSTDGIPILTSTMLPSDAGFQLKVSLNAPQNYRIQNSTNLTSSVWQDATNITNSKSPYVWTDTNASSSTKLYKLVSP